MYFIPRNNKFYHYIAHMNVKNRYLYTGFFIIFVFFVAGYCLQRLITLYTDIYAQELSIAQKQYKDVKRIEEKNKSLTASFDVLKQEIQKNVVNTASQYFKQQLFFVLETIKQSGLKLNSYGVQKEKEYGWYKKEKAHFDITGSFKNIMDFFESIKNSQKMILISQWNMVQLQDDLFQVHCDIEFVVVIQI